jgi:hypothetical protein
VIWDALILALVNGLFAAAGAGVCAAAGWWRVQRPGLASLGLAYLVGVASYGVVAQILYVCGASLSRLQIVVVCGALCLGGLAWDARRPRPRAPHLRLVVPAAVVAATAAMLALLAVDLWYQPLWSYDAWTMWTPKARALAALDGLDAGWFTSADVISKDYPLLLPAVEAAGFRFTGYRTELLDLQSLLFVVAFVVAYLDLAVRRAPGLVACAALVSVVFAPSLASQLAGAVADVPLACLFAVAGILGWIWLADRQPAALALASVLVAGAATTKAEGLALGLAFAAGLAAAELVARRSPVRSLLTVGAGLAVAVVPWRVWLAWQDVESQASVARADAGVLADNAAELPHIAVFLAARMLDPSQWLLAVPLGLVALVHALRARRVEPAVFALVTAGVTAALLTLAYWTSPFDLEYHLQTSARRVVTPLVFFVAVSAPLLARPSRGSTRGGYPQPS